MASRARRALLGLCRASVVVAAAALTPLASRAEPVAGDPPAAARTRRTFSPASIVPPAGSAVAALRAALAGGDGQAALALADASLAASTDPDETAELHWLAAVVAEQLGDRAARSTHLTWLSSSTHPLAPYARLQLAEGLLASNPTRAAQLASTLTGQWGGSWTAQMTEARALAALGRQDDAIARYRAIVAGTPDDVAAVSAGMPLVNLLVARGTVSDITEAIAVLRRIASRSAGTPVATSCLSRVTTLLATLPDAERAAQTPMPPVERLQEGAAHARALRFDVAARLYTQLAEDPASEGAVRCEARLEAGRALLRARERRAAVAHLEWVGEHCTDPEHVAWARYEAGRGYSALSEADAAIVQFDALERQTPTHRLADDARYRSAALELERGNAEAFRARLSELPTRYPTGDMRERALVELALEARDRSDWAAAQRHLEAALAGPLGAADSEGMEGRTPYWMARTLQDLQRTEDATAMYARVIREWPLSYHAQLAATRLGAISPDALERALAPLRHSGPEPTLSFPDRPEYQSEGFRAAVSLFRVGDVSRARWALEALGALGGADTELLWVAAALFDRAGDRPGAMQLVRAHGESLRHIAPVGRGRALWRLAYPAAFAPLIEESAAREELPAAFVRAIAREESSFNPGAVSWANAYGLVQVILPTARRYGAPLGLTVDATTLRDPEVNLRVGTRFMRFLFDRYPTNVAVVPAAYNAGQGALDRWLRARQREEGYAFDRFVEEIPYDETRRYTRRVLQSYGVYSWLDAGRLPTMPETIPPPG
ncbi:MAG: transglycosylase SLT domain-containing protein [Myxococcales bacterium]|nr:transglycosylase SLT domain-containing protein [Myxococcales bacterium]